MTKTELNKISLPYVSTSKNKIATLNFGEATAILKGNLPYVRNSQVAFAIDIPEDESAKISVLRNIYLMMDVTKASRDKYDMTEALCRTIPFKILQQ